MSEQALSSSDDARASAHGSSNTHATAGPRVRSAADLIAQLARVAQGDQRAMRAVHRATYAKLLSVVARIIVDRDECEDVLQEVYLTVWRKAGAYDSRIYSPISWLAAIARNRAIDRWRARAWMRLNVAIDTALDVPDPARSASDSLEARDLLRQVALLVGKMDARTSAALRMTVVEGISCKAVARSFGVPEATMKSTIRRALLAVRAHVSR